jgi:starch synthase
MMKILMVASELAEVAPVGGIAEYVLGLATSLLRRGHEVQVAIPSYAYLRSRQDLRVVNERLIVQLGVGMSEVTAVHEMHVDCPGPGHLQLPVLLIGDHKHFSSVRLEKEIYQWPNHEPWIAFSRSIVDLLNFTGWRPDVIHCQDAHTSLIPIYVKQMREFQPRSFAAFARTVLTVHNLLNQGVGPAGVVDYAGLPHELFQLEGFEYHGSANCFKAGLLAADRASTVSRTYAEEICRSSEYGFGLEGVLRRLKSAGRLEGIVNGIDEDRWRMKGVRYDGSDRSEEIIRAKDALRQSLYPRWNWQLTDEPVIAFRSRWDNQKGVGILGECIEQLLGLARVVVRAWGTEEATGELRSLWRRFEKLAGERPERFIINPEGLSTMGDIAAYYTIADFFLMPSRYEPCGLTQMECQRYGTIPVVRKTGGLADTVSETVTPDLASPNGFVFQEMKASALLRAVERAVAAFHDPRKRNELIRNALLQRNGWDSRVEQYEALFAEARTSSVGRGADSRPGRVA